MKKILSFLLLCLSVAAHAESYNCHYTNTLFSPMEEITKDFVISVDSQFVEFKENVRGQDIYFSFIMFQSKDERTLQYHQGLLIDNGRTIESALSVYFAPEQKSIKSYSSACKNDLRCFSIVCQIK